MDGHTPLGSKLLAEDMLSPPLPPGGVPITGTPKLPYGVVPLHRLSTVLGTMETAAVGREVCKTHTGLTRWDSLTITHNTCSCETLAVCMLALWGLQSHDCHMTTKERQQLVHTLTQTYTPHDH